MITLVLSLFLTGYDSTQSQMDDINRRLKNLEIEQNIIKDKGRAESDVEFMEREMAKNPDLTREDKDKILKDMGLK